jgi:hemerythrin-like domain-containing protein
MKTLASLIEDHRLLHGVLDALETFATQIETTGPADSELADSEPAGDGPAKGDAAVDRGDLKLFSAFFRVFGDVHHATKEEQVLFPSLALHGADWDQGPLAEAQQEHRQERYFLRSLDQAAHQQRELTSEDVRHLVSELKGYAESMRNHLRMEDEFVFPLVDEMSEADQATLAAKLDRFDRTPPSSTDGPEMREIAKTLLQRYRHRA